MTAVGTATSERQDFATLTEVWDEAERRLESHVWNFLVGGAGEESTVRANRAAFGRWQIRPRHLSGIGPPRTETTFLGLPLAMPIMPAPFGADRMFHDDGQLAVARAAERFGVPSFVAAGSGHSLASVADVAPRAAKVFQIHPVGSSSTFAELLRRAAGAGYEAICVTVDSPTRGWRERIRADRFAQESSQRGANYPDAPGEFLSQLEDMDQPVWSWSQLAEAYAGCSLPMIVKGVLTAADARAAVDAGARALVVSNHGGRQLDSAPASLDQLQEIVGEVGGEVEIVLDSGVRRATDVFKALALGASTVLIGRAVVVGLAAAGEDGVHAVLELMHRELRNTMALAGCGSVADIDGRLLQPAPAVQTNVAEETTW